MQKPGHTFTHVVKVHVLFMEKKGGNIYLDPIDIFSSELIKIASKLQKFFYGKILYYTTALSIKAAVK